MKWLAGILLLILPACSSAAPRSGPPASTVAPTTTTTPSTTKAVPSTTVVAGPCRGSTPPPSYQHVVVIVMENRGAGQVYGSAQAPYINHLGGQCGVATDYSGVSHPSLPNYIAMTSGGTQGISDDDGPSSHHLTAPSIFSLLGNGWRSLEESMPSPCAHGSSGEYAVKHNPAAYYTGVSAGCRVQDVALDDSAPDLSARYTFVAPNLCHDGHDCSTATADHWLSVEVPLMLGSPQYRSGSTVLFVTWDENDSGGSLVPMFVVAPSVRPGTRSTSPFDHYSLLRTTEELLGLSPLLANGATAASMRAAFNL